MGVEHACDNQKASCDGALADAEQKAADEEAREVVAGSVSAEDDAPDQNVTGHPFSRRKLLQTQRLWPLEDEIGKIEDGSKPIVLRLR